MLHTLQRERQQVCRLPEKYFVTRSSVVASFDLEFSFADFWSLSFSSSCWPCCAPSFPNLRFLSSTKERVQYKGMHVITTAIEELCLSALLRNRNIGITMSHAGAFVHVKKATRFSNPFSSISFDRFFERRMNCKKPTSEPRTTGKVSSSSVNEEVSRDGYLATFCCMVHFWI